MSKQRGMENELLEKQISDSIICILRNRETKKLQLLVSGIWFPWPFLVLDHELTHQFQSVGFHHHHVR